MRPPRFQTWALLVHGALIDPPETFVQRVLAQVVRALPEGQPDSLSEEEFMNVETNLNPEE